MATHDYNIANQSGADFRADLNNALSAILSNNASATEPTTTAAYMLWVDTGNNLLKMRNSDDNAWITLPVSITTSNTVDIDGGTVNTITSLSFSSGETVTTILDEDDLSSDDASALATQQSIKAYVDSQVTAQDLDFQGDTGGALSIDLDSETFTISGGNGIATSGALNTLTIAIDSSVVTLTDTQTLTNKSIDADSNTISNLEVDNLKSGVLDTDLTSVSASDDTLASSKAIKTYVDAQVTAQDLDITDGTTSISIDLDSEELSVLGGTGVTSTASGNGITLAIGQDVGTTADVTFNTVAADLTGDVTGTVSSIANHSTSDLSEGTNLYYTTARFDSAFSGKSTSDLTEGTNLYFTDERVDDRVNNLLVAGSNVTLTYDDVANTLTIAATEDNLSNNTTDDLSEGSTNLYYTDARARAAISASGDLSYNSTTGVISFTERTDAEVRGLVSASGDLSYNSTTGVFSFTERTDSEVRGLLSGGTGVTYNNTTGVISIGQAVGTSDNVTFGDVIVSGDLTVSGTTTTINTETINLADNIILFNSNATGTPSENAGIEIERGDATNKTLIWNETDDKWTVGSETFVAGTFEGALTGNVTGTVSSLANHDTGDLAEGTNLYYTTARFDSAFSGKSTSDLTEGTNLYYTTARANSDFDTRLATKSTSDLAEGTNLYYTDARFDTRLATKTTDNLTEGSTNLYYTDARVDSHLSGGTGVTYSSGTISIGQAVGTGDSVTFAGVTSDFTGDIEGAVKFTAKADVALTKGQVVYISGVSGTVPTVNLADADNASAMPAFGLVAANANQNAEVEIITFGSLTGLNTSAFTVGKSVYVSTTAGALTTTAPTGESSLIQNIGQVQRSHAADGIIKVGGAGRTNATPNLNSGKIFYGNGSNQSVATTLDTSIVPENTNLYYTDARANSAIDARVTKSFVDALGIAASTATTLATARDFSLTGDVTAAGVSFDGSGNVALTTSIGSNTVGITELNVTDGTSGQVLTTDGAGTLSFADAAAGYSDSDVETYLDTGTSTPTFASIVVNGTIKLDGNYPTGTGNVALGDQALDSVITGGDNNTAIGDVALTANTTGDANTALGRFALFSNTTASYNSGIGYGTLYANSTGANNVAVGYLSLNQNTTASNNTAVGYNSLYANTTGTGLTAVGAGALEDNTTGNYNTAVGKSANAFNTTGSENTSMGNDALLDNTTGENNVAIGSSALANNTTAWNNTAVGRHALLLNTTGTNNIGIGSSALAGNTTGSQNTAVGRQAALNTTTGNNNSAFGYQALATNTTGYENVAVGKSSMAVNTTGYENVAVGVNALDANTSGAANTALGMKALTSNTTATGNTAVGREALQLNTTGASNVAVGMKALDQNTTASNNTAVGYYSLQANTTGTQNNAFGQVSLASCTTGSYNCAFGQATLNNLTTGSSNTAMGDNAMQFTTTGYDNTCYGENAGRNISSGHNNTFIGHDASNNTEHGTENTVIGSSSATSGVASNSQIVIGYSVSGSANNRVHIGNASSYIYANFNTNATWTHSSDERSKKDIKPSILGLEFINELKPVTYKFKSPSEYPQEWESYDANKTKPSDENTQHGMIAQDVKAALDKLGVEDFKGWDVLPDGKQVISEAMFVFPLIKAVQELSAQVEELKSKLGE